MLMMAALLSQEVLMPQLSMRDLGSISFQRYNLIPPREAALVLAHFALNVSLDALIT